MFYLLEHGGLSHVLPPAVHLGWNGVVVVAYKILVSAPVPLELILTGFDWVGAVPRGFWDNGFGTRA